MVDAMEYLIEIKYNKRPNLLSQLSEKYGSDKGFSGSNFMTKNGWQYHSYTDFYDFMFNHKKNDIKNMFEMGIGSTSNKFLYNMGPNGTVGASLKMWKEYFPHADIFGADIDPDCLFQEERISTHLVDQLSKSSIEKMTTDIGRSFDLIIDDGLHEYEANICMYENMIGYLNNGGTYIIEDVKNNILEKYENYFSSINENFYSVKLHRPYSELSDNCLIVIFR